MENYNCLTPDPSPENEKQRHFQERGVNSFNKKESVPPLPTTFLVLSLGEGVRG